MHKIAVVEDDVAIQTMYKFKLVSSGFNVKTGNNGQEGLKLCDSFRPDIVLLDIRMPVMNGDEMLKKLRETDWGANMRVIVLTNVSKDEAPHELRFLNVDRYLVKAHHTPAQVVEITKEVLEQ